MPFRHRKGFTGTLLLPDSGRNLCKLLLSFFSSWQIYSLLDSLGTCHLPSSWSLPTELYPSLHLRIKRVSRIRLMGYGAGSALFFSRHHRCWAAFCSSKRYFRRGQSLVYLWLPSLHYLISPNSIKKCECFLEQRGPYLDLSIFPNYWLPCPNFLK